MAPADHPESAPANAETPATTGIQTPAETPSSTEGASIPLAPLPRPPRVDAARFLQLRDWLDAALIVLVVAFAFLVASFPATNPDLFRELAAGRLLVNGGYQFGVDPFAFSADDEYWVNHSWLYGLLSYGLYQLPGIGATALVVFKALLIAGLAGILLLASRRPGQSWWIPAACTGGAILALSPRLYLQSVCLSYLFLGLTMWLLCAGRQAERQRLWWLLPPLFALWSNCDKWFCLGPLTAALYLIGELIQQWVPIESSAPAASPEADAAERQHRLVTLGAVVGVGLLACLINPQHVHVLELPAELGFSSANDLIEHDPQFRTLFLSPLRGDYYDPNLGLSIAGMAFWPLMATGLVSFLFTFNRVPWSRLLIWLSFALLSLYNVRVIPYFAIVAGPITAWNWLDYAAHVFGKEPCLTPGWRNGSLGGRALTVLLVVLAIVATFPGLLQNHPELRRVGWDVRVDPSLQAMAEQIKEWRAGNALPEEPHWFNMHYEVANYLAWFAPGERVFLDQTLPHYRKAADDYLSIRQRLEKSGEKPSPTDAESEDDSHVTLKRDWRSVLRNRKVHFWIFDNQQLNKAELAARQTLFTAEDEWIPCYLGGRIAIFAWRDPADKHAADFAANLKLDLRRKAFGPEAEQAPSKGPETIPTPPSTWEALWRARPEPSMHRETAELYNVRFQGLMPRYSLRNARAWQGAVETSAIGLSVPLGPMPNSLLAISWSCTYANLFPAGATHIARKPLEREMPALQAWNTYVQTQDDGPPECLYLSLRAARRALLDNAGEPQSYLQLGQSYLLLQEQTKERALKGLAPQLAEIRRTQMIAAFRNCLNFHPSEQIAFKLHVRLSESFHQYGYVDVATDHFRQAVELLKSIVTKQGSGEGVSKQMDEMTKQLSKLEHDVKHRQDEFDVNSVGKPIMKRVEFALKQGLAETALSTFRQAGPEDLSGRNVGMVRSMMEVALNLGRLEDANELLNPEPEKTAGKPVSPEYLLLHVRLAAARGDYAEADRHLADALTYAWKDARGTSPIAFHQEFIGSLVGQVLLEETRPLLGIPRLPLLPEPAKQESARNVPREIPTRLWVRNLQLEAMKRGIEIQEVRANWQLMRGWLALESGRCRDARQHFRAALDEQVSPATWLPAVRQLKIFPENAPTQMRVKLDMMAQQQIHTRNVIRYYLHWLDNPPR